ncbi:hypothetical protein GJ744_000250 [Endocarpon pusillum]|uniref:Mog1p/PsbP-like protein n=1 Tax=Endocarpon pusillum TaxID=364733 RepID=A0A8H7E910_9EURO|nr:hypothetical protein GJ744_000250 [Endocarpon pusillum]
MASFSAQDLYGGAMRAHLPRDYIDASKLRQIPDHQEVFVSATTLSSVVVEINQYVAPSAVAAAAADDDAPAVVVDPSSSIMIAAPAGPAAPEALPECEAARPEEATLDADDRAAALYHLGDLVDAHDTLTAVSAPRPVRLQSASLRGVPAVVVRARLSAREGNAGGQVESLLPPSSYRHGAAPGDVETSTSTTTTTIRLLLVRLEAWSTDLCVVVNVPWKELGRAGPGGEKTKTVQEEEAFADAVLENLVASLDVKDFALFDG